MPKTRGQGEGGVWRGTDGTWRGVVELGRDFKGRRIRKEVTGKTKRVVLDKLDLARSNAKKGIITDDLQSVGAYLEEWLTSPEVVRLRPATREQYAYIVNKFLVPELGRVKLSKLTPQQVEHMLTRMGQPKYAEERSGGKGRPRAEDGSLSPRTRQLTRTVLRRALSRAVKFGIVGRNVAELADAPKSGQSGSPTAFSAEDARLLRAACLDDPYGPIVLLALATGMRQGELLALRWSDIDLDAGSLRVSGSLSRVAGKVVIAEPKTKAGKRSVPLGSLAHEALRLQRRRQSSDRLAARRPDGRRGIVDFWHETGHVFTTPIGTPLEARNVLRQFHNLCATAGIDRKPFHALRHTTATLMLTAGVPLSTISAQLGHAGLAITADIYAEVGEVLKLDAAHALDRVMTG